MQFDSMINRWHTCPTPPHQRLEPAPSTCSSTTRPATWPPQPDEVQEEEDEFDLESFNQAVDVTILAQEILIDNAGYPTKAIERNSWDFRPLGLGYANLGALLMSRGLPYDGEEGRNYAACVTSVMHGRANLMSARIAQQVGPFPGYIHNQESMLSVMRMHQAAAAKVSRDGVPDDLFVAAQKVWKDVLAVGSEYGFRNGQVTVLAPTGTIGFMMDCDTTGIEPDIALVKYKKLVGGGMMKIVNQTVPQALRHLGYTPSQCEDILAYLDAHDTIEGAPHLNPDHLPVFDCAFKPVNGTRYIHYLGHIRMMGAVQPFLSGAISKTVNCRTTRPWRTSKRPTSKLGNSG
jgi:ribonucleoside-diphosphate reductase alpha chain